MAFRVFGPRVGDDPAVPPPVPADEPYGDISGVKLLKPAEKIDMKSVPPPAGAIVLFDGKNLDDWVKTRPKTTGGWQLLDGGIMQVNKTGDICQQAMFASKLKLHVEFRVPYMPRAKGQGRGNSGVYLQGRYEVQILDSYGLESKNDDCGAIYTIAAPLVNACKAPTVWQSYDIEFTPPTCDNGKKTAPPAMTVYHNGVKIHETSRSPRTTRPPAWAATFARPARSCSRITATPYSFEMSGC